MTEGLQAARKMLFLCLHWPFSGRENIVISQNFQIRQTNLPEQRLLVIP